MRGVDWQWEDQDGGNGRRGKVTEIQVGDGETCVFGGELRNLEFGSQLGVRLGLTLTSVCRIGAQQVREVLLMFCGTTVQRTCIEWDLKEW